MRKLSIAYIEDFLKLNRPNIHLIENQEYKGNKSKLFFYCDICNEEEPFATSFENMSSGNGCPYCSHVKVGKKNNLKFLFPEISLEWDYEKNYPLIPEDIIAGSGIKRFWICKKCKESYEAEVYNRTYIGTNCPYCSFPIRKVGTKNNLEFLFPDVALDWDFDKNFPLVPSKIASHSNKRVWWKCRTCHYEWIGKVADRVLSKGCIVCNHEIASYQYNLELMFPQIAAEWDYRRNFPITPSNVVPSSAKKYYWICPECEQSYLSDPSHRTGKDFRSCPFCASSRIEKRVKRFLINKNIYFEVQKRFDNCKDIRVLPFDFFFPSMNFVLEAQGHQHYFPVRFGGIDVKKAEENFEKNKIRDQIKRNYCNENNIKLVEIPYWKFNDVEDILCIELNITSEERRT